MAALVQLRHMRSSNQITALTEIREALESPEFQSGLTFNAGELQAIVRDPNRRHELFEPSELLQRVRTVANLFEGTGALVKAGIIDRDLACDIWGYVTLR